MTKKYKINWKDTEVSAEDEEKAIIKAFENNLIEISFIEVIEK